MKLKEQLNLCKGKDVKIGSKVSFFYCDTNDDQTESTLEVLSKVEFKRLLANKEKLERHLETFEAFWKDKIEKKVIAFNISKEAKFKKLKNISKELKKNYETKLQELKSNALLEKQKDYIYSTNTLNLIVKRIKEWTPFLERQVKEVYDSIINDYTIIIRVAGQEAGLYWDQDEYRKAKKEAIK